MRKYNIDLHDKVILVTGVEGFISSNLLKTLLNSGNNVTIICIYNMND